MSKWGRQSCLQPAFSRPFREADDADQPARRPAAARIGCPTADLLDARRRATRVPRHSVQAKSKHPLRREGLDEALDGAIDLAAMEILLEFALDV